MIGIIVAIVLAVSALGGGTVYASQGSLPGEFLYPVKLGTEQARLVIATNDTAKAELYLTFANRRVEEMTDLTEKGRPENLDIAVNGYDKAMAMAIEKIEEASGKGLEIADISEEVALAASVHVDVLVGLLDTVPAEAVPGIQTAIDASESGHGNAVLALAGENPVRAMEINLAAMEGSLNRAKAKAEENDFEAMEVALAQFQALNELGGIISEIARGLGEGTTTDVGQLVTEITAFHLEILTIVYGIVPDGEAKSAIERAMDVSVEGYQGAVEALEEAGALGDIPEEPLIPAGIPDELKEKLLKPEEVPATGRP